LGREEVRYLGFVINREGLGTDPEKILAVQFIPTPKKTRDVRSFLGLTGYYRRFIKNYSSIAIPLYALTSPKVNFEWSVECKRAFQQLKEALVKAAILKHANFQVAFRLYTDASTLGLGAVLTQVIEGRERLIYFASRVLHDAKPRYETSLLELLAIKWAIEKFNHFWYLPFEVFTDH